MKTTIQCPCPCCEETDKLKEVLSFLQNVSLTLGLTHGTIFNILQKDDKYMREDLLALFNKLSQTINKVYYPAPDNPLESH